MKKARVIVTWILSVALAALFVLAAVPKLQGQAEQAFVNLGYTAWFSYVIGFCEVLGAVLLLVPAVAFYGATLLGVIMVGAIYTHLSTGVGNPVGAIVFLLVAVALTVLRYRDALFFGKRQERIDGPA